MQKKRIAIVQSSYIPWRGYFDLISQVDEFVLFDNVQYTKRDWRNRNQIKTIEGLKWLSIPVQVKQKFTQLIKDVVVCDNTWADKHWRAIELNYRRSPFFLEIANHIRFLYLEAKKMHKLSEINYLMIKTICDMLGIKTKLTWSMDYEVTTNDKNQRLIQICKAANASDYLSGPAAKCYIEESTFKEQNITVEYMSYNNYPVYTQRFQGFVPAVSILDLLFNVGLKKAPFYIKQL